MPTLKEGRRGAGNFAKSNGEAPNDCEKLDASKAGERKQLEHGKPSSGSRDRMFRSEDQEPCAVKVASTVPWGGKCCETPTYPDRNTPRRQACETWSCRRLYVS